MLLSGEAGIGKSRLTAALLERLAHRATHALALFLLPAAHRQRVLSDHRPDGTRRRPCARRHPQAKLDKLDALLAQTSTSTQDAALLAELLSLPNDGRYPALDLAPQQRRQKTLEALISQIEVADALQPGADDLRGCALDRPFESGSARSTWWTGSQPFACC